MASPIDKVSFPIDRVGKLFFKSEYVGLITVTCEFNLFRYYFPDIK